MGALDARACPTPRQRCPVNGRESISAQYRPVRWRQIGGGTSRAHTGGSMRTQRFLAALAAINLALAACPSVDVHTVPSPDAHPAALHTFSVMPHPNPPSPSAPPAN